MLPPDGRSTLLSQTVVRDLDTCEGLLAWCGMGYPHQARRPSCLSQCTCAETGRLHFSFNTGQNNYGVSPVGEQTSSHVEVILVVVADAALWSSPGKR